MLSISNVSREDFVKVDTLILEDELEVLNNLSQRFDELPYVRLKTTQQYDEAMNIAMSGKCSLFVTDLVINVQNEEGRNKPIMANKILRKIKQKGYNIPAIVTSGYPDKMDDVQKENLAEFYVQKSYDSEEAVLKKTAELSGVIHKTRACFYDIIDNLEKALNSKELDDAVTHYKNAKNLIKYINYEDESIPVSHRKGYWAFSNLVLFLSAIPSPSIKLNCLTHEAYKLINSFANILLQPNFCYMKDARNILDKLKLLGYNYTPLIDMRDWDETTY